ncbi:translation initiation factor IF-2 [Sporothrix stenoceras]|uniref:Translation initiation factor IF-2, mitochondrial n=1 Tax=Sporothrix stenoceras TaxID=5173 RepID=A0ABR3YSU8_9PEZI
MSVHPFSDSTATDDDINKLHLYSAAEMGLNSSFRSAGPDAKTSGGWGQLAPRPPPHQQSSWQDQSASSRLSPRLSQPIRPPQSRSAPGQQWSSLKSEPIQRGPPPGSNSRRETSQGREGFWSQLESRVGNSAAGRDGWQSAAGDRVQRAPESYQNTGSRGGWDSQPRVRNDNYGKQQTPQWSGEQQNLFTPEVDVATTVFSSPDFESRNSPARQKKNRKEKPAASKSKAKKRPQDRGFVMDDEDDFVAVDEMEEERQRRKAEKMRQREEAAAAAAAGPIPILLPEFISVAHLGAALRVRSTLFLEQLGELGFEDITLETMMSGETAALVAQEYGYEPTVDSGGVADLKRSPPPEDISTLPERPPIVTIMGHVDHGKTTMLDWLRSSSVAAQEHGGITQHIGAFSVKLSTGKQITFLDTPGHAAFLTMRQRGASVTDIVILVVAADDGVKPQTLEALKHARGANVPVIVAINKIDKDEARIDHVKADLARHGIEIEDFGGDVQVACVSGKTGLGMETLEENILTLSEILDVRANPDGMAEGWVLESSVKSVGRSASILVKSGTLRKGDIIAAGTTWAKIRMMRNEAGVEVEEAPPGTPVEVLGWRSLPDAGDEVIQAPTEARVREAVNYRLDIKHREKAVAESVAQEKRERERAALAEAAAAATAAPDAPEFEKARRRHTGTGAVGDAAGTAGDTDGRKALNFIVKGDVMGSVEAVCAAIMEVGNNEVQPVILLSAPGQVNESDIEHAAITKSAVVNFNSPLQGNIKKMAKDAGVDILDYPVIYHLVDEIRDRLSELLPPLITTKVLGEADVLQIFPIHLRGRVVKNIAGCRVRNGQMTNKCLYRLFRKDKVVFEGKLESLRSGKKEVTEMRKGSECGLMFEEWDGMEVGDKIQAYEEVRTKRHL